MQITDTQRLNWLIENVTYLEHKIDGELPHKVPLGAWWPQEPKDINTDPDLVGLNLKEYIDAFL